MANTKHDRPTASAVEQHSIDFIPERDRGGNVRSLFTIWFGANMQIIGIVTGAIGVTLGLPLSQAVVAVVVGNVVGAIAMALHSAQGPKLGIPQMIQSRAQFGFHGAIAPLLIVVLMYLGFYASGIVLGGRALAAWVGIGYIPAAILIAAVTTVIAIFGYWVIHALEKVVSVATAVAFIYITVKLLTEDGASAAWHAHGELDLGLFLLVVSLAATYQITYAPYVADYSRYLPSSTSVRAAFWWTYSGTVIATTWMMTVGCLAAAISGKAFGAGSSTFLVGLAPHGLGWLISLILVIGIVAVNIPNLYGMFMSVTTTLTALFRLKMDIWGRMGFMVAGSVISTFIAIVGEKNFVTNLENFILFLAYGLIPWTAINLTDFYLVRKERYDITSIFDKDGVYGRVNARTMTAYLVSIAVEIPFVSTTFYTGPLVRHLGGADISWIIGLIVPCVLYYILMRPLVQNRHPSVAQVAPGTSIPS